MAKIPVVDLSTQWRDIKSDALGAVERVLDKGQYILGTEVANLETEVARYVDTRFGVGVANGTDALTIALQALGIQDGDEVITTPFTFFATAEAIQKVGATPVFADIDERNFTLSAPAVEAKITKRTKALLPVHIFGLMADMEKLRALADKYNLVVVEDACQAIGSRWNGHAIGTLSDAAALSFFPTKNLGGYGDGGMIVTNSEQLVARMKRLRVHGSEKKYIHEELGWNSRLDEIQAALLRIKLSKLDNWNQQRQSLAYQYNQAFQGLPIRTPIPPTGAGHVYHLYTILTAERDGLQKHLARQNIGSAVYYPLPLHMQPALASLSEGSGAFPVAEQVCQRCLSLPLFPGMTESEQSSVIEAVRNFFS